MRQRRLGYWLVWLGLALFFAPALQANLVIWPHLGKPAKKLWDYAILENDAPAEAAAGSLGKLPWPPSAFVNARGSRYWITLPAAGKKPWRLLAVDADSGEKQGEVDIGWRHPLDPKYFAQYAVESADGDHLYALVLDGSVWGLASFDLSDFKQRAKVALDKGRPKVELIADRRVLVHSRHNSGKRDIVWLLDPESGQVLFQQIVEDSHAFTVKLSADKERVLLLSHSEFVYAIDKRTLKEMTAKRTRLDVVDVRSGKLLESKQLGVDGSTMTGGPDDQYRYFIADRKVKSDEVLLWRTDGYQTEVIAGRDQSCRANGLVVSEQVGLLAIPCSGELILYDLAANDLRGTVRTKLWAESGFFGATGKYLFLNEYRGSEVVMVDLHSLTLAGRAESGSTAKKFGNVFGNLALGVTTAWFTPVAIMPFSQNFDDTSLLLDEDESNLFVMNLGTQDVTAYDLQALTRVSVTSVPGSAERLLRVPGSQYVFALARKGIVAIHGETLQREAVWRDGRFAGASAEDGRLYFSDRTGLKIIDAGDLSEVLLPQHPNTLQVVSRSGFGMN